ncbi:MAG: Na/Pi cotransporter family protein [Elusimicrobiota bacterium]|jgi:phosphate:Na+ symporter|nr:Na/Pi cotransporter family protein [Elusimicrobiota bacterium]
MAALSVLMNLLGGLGIFLLGIKMMSDGLQKAAGDRLRKIISKATGNRFTATFSGFAVTSVIQSSSATTVMVVGFVSAGLLTLTQALGVIFGANIGTTATAWIISLLGFKFDIALFAMPAIGIGFFSQFIQKWPIIRRSGEALLGFGLLFLGLSLIKDAIPNVQDSPFIMELATKFSPTSLLSLLLVVGVGTVFTLIFQSSSAVMALTITLAAKGLIDYPTAAALVLGENIGTTITANIAAIGAPRMAKRAAFGHFMFNMLGVVWAVLLFKPFLSLVDWIVPGTTTGLTEQVLLVSIPYHLSAFHTTFNVINTGIMLTFIKPFEKLIMLILPLKRSEENKTDLVYLKGMLTTTPELSMIAVRKEVGRMAQIVEHMVNKIMRAIKSDSDKLFDRAIEDLHSSEQTTDVLEFKINDFLKNLVHEPLSRNMIAEVMTTLDITNYYEKMADNGDRIAILLAKAKAGKHFDEHDLQRLEEIGQKVKRILCETRAVFLADKIDNNAVIQTALQRERELNDIRHAFRNEKTMRDYTQDAQISPVAITLFADILTSFEKIGDYALNIVEAKTGVREETLEQTAFLLKKEAAKKGSYGETRPE